MQYSPNPRSSAKQHHARPDRVANGLGVTPPPDWGDNRLPLIVDVGDAGAGLA
jgi:hypothetical protein